jgi:hypothetical protein
MLLLHDFHDIARGSFCCEGDETITVDSPPSIVVSAIERYLQARDKLLDLIVPIDNARRFGLSALCASVAVEYEVHPNRAIMGRYDDRLVVRFTSMDTAEQFFNGRFTIRPLSGRTAMQLKGHFIPPPDLLARASSSGVFDSQSASLTIRILLRELKAVVEAEFQSFRAGCEPVLDLHGDAASVS